jgi:NADPH:quinone reductase-like Zn-dependent oxidoreductase
MKLHRLLPAVLLSCALPGFGADAPAPAAATMKAIVYHDYGPPEVLKLEDLPKPVPADEQILVRVRAASINPLDWHYMQGTPLIMRLDAGLRHPKEPRLGVDFAGTVEAVGKNVRRFKPGDEVFGGRNGAFAQYVVVREERAVTAKPANVGFEEAASVPVAGITALQALRDQGKVQAGQKVLINGASGGVGTFAVQIAKALGAQVTGVCSGKNAEMVKALGADKVIDYTREDFTAGAEHYDVIIDNVGNNHSLSELRGVLTPKGRLVIIGGGGANEGRWVATLDRALYAWAYSKFVDQHMGTFFADLNQKDLAELAGLMQAGKVKAVIDRRYPLAELPAAIGYLEQGHARGKVVIDVE